MLIGQLPKTIDPRKLAHRGAALDGVIALTELSRVGDLLADCDGNVQVRLQFEQDEQGIYLITGELDTAVHMVCQRCLEPVTLPVNAEIEVALAWSEDNAQSLPKHYDPLIVGDELVLRDLIEDELLLSLPLVPYHDVETCGSGQDYSTGSFEELETVEEDKPNPFSVLAKLKAGKASNQEN